MGMTCAASICYNKIGQKQSCSEIKNNEERDGRGECWVRRQSTKGMENWDGRLSALVLHYFYFYYRILLVEYGIDNLSWSVKYMFVHLPRITVKITRWSLLEWIYLWLVWIDSRYYYFTFYVTIYYTSYKFIFWLYTVDWIYDWIPSVWFYVRIYWIWLCGRIKNALDYNNMCYCLYIM